MYINNFFDVPEDIVEISKSVTYGKNKYGLSPGFRSEPLEEKFPTLCKFITFKVLAQYYDLTSPINVSKTETHFMRVPYSSGEGITHSDDSTITAIAYLNADVSGCGTSIYKRKRFITDRSAQDMRAKHFETDIETNDWVAARDSYNSNYQEIMKVNGDFNSAVVFNGFLPHRMNIDSVDKEGERLTIIQFIEGITAPESPEERFEIARGVNGL